MASEDPLQAVKGQVIVVLRDEDVRQETRGGHRRTDFPGTDDERWRGRLVARRNPDGDVLLDYLPLEDE